MNISKATKNHHQSILELLSQNNLPISDVNFNEAQFYVFGKGNKVIAAGAVELYGNDILLRSVVVQENHKGKGIGKEFVETLLHRYHTYPAYLLTEDAAGFFRKLGFEEIARDAVSSPVKSSSQFLDVCPSTAVCMKKEN